MKMITDYSMVQKLREIKQFQTPKNLFLKILIFVGVFMMVSIAESIPLVIGVVPRMMAWTMEQAQLYGGEVPDEVVNEYVNNMLADSYIMRLMLFSTVMGTLVAIFFCRVAEGRKLPTMGFVKKGFALQYLIGLIAGFVMFSAVVMLSYFMGGLKPETAEGAAIGGLVIMFLGYVVQGMSEEVIFRGYFMTTLLRDHKPWVAILVNSVGFALVHGANPGISLFEQPVVTILAMLNLTLFGVMVSLYMLRTGSIWGACAIHTIWNFVQGNFYGLPVSGTDSGESVFSFSLAENMGWANGGAFGIEASVATTIVMGVLIALLLFVPFGRKAASAEAAPSQEEA